MVTHHLKKLHINIEMSGFDKYVHMWFVELLNICNYEKTSNIIIMDESL